MAISFERAFRIWLRATFKARIVHDEQGFVMKTKGKTTKVEIQNARTVMTNLLSSRACKLLKESAKASVFRYTLPKKEGGGDMTITLSHVGNHDLLTVVHQ